MRAVYGCFRRQCSFVVDNRDNAITRGGFRVRSNVRGWSLLAGVIIILAACIFSYMLTRPAEADVAILLSPSAAHVA